MFWTSASLSCLVVVVQGLATKTFICLESFQTVQRRQQKLWVTGEDWKAGDKGVLEQKSGSTTMMREHIRRVHDIDVGLKDSKKKNLCERAEKITNYATSLNNAGSVQYTYIQQLLLHVCGDLCLACC